MEKEELKKDLKIKMDKTISNLENDLKGLRTGRASPNLLDPVQVEIYGNRQPLRSLATVSASDPRTLIIQVWDKSNVKAVEKAIVDANLGITPNVDGQSIRINIPSMTEERRKAIAKLASEYGENAKVAIRKIRQNGNEDLKNQEGAKNISKDELDKLLKIIQNLTNEFINKINEKISSKEKEIKSM